MPSHSRLPHRSLGLAALALTLLTHRLGAQCADGSPPPCKSATAASSVRRVSPALDARSWIVVPFANVMRAQDLDWLRDASVNLLSLDLSRWTDIKVVPDKRVSDLLRELPTSPSATALSLNDGLAIARRAGAGMLVMGDFFKVGSGARLVANVFDVKTGARIRSAAQQAPNQDSLLTAFTPLARAVLAVPPPPDARLGDLGTTSVDAYQSYLLGVKALDHDEIDAARRHLARAIALDSTFALAHLQLSYALAWGEGDPNGGETRAHALAARRLGASLPVRERTLIEAQLAGASNDHARSCDLIQPLVARDSSDIQALTLWGECNYHDNSVRPSATDTTTGTFKSSYNVALRTFQRILQLDPAYYVAFEHILDMLRQTGRGGCTEGKTGTACSGWYAVMRREADTLVTVPVRTYSAAYWAQRQRAEQEKPALVNLAQARRIAQEWVDADTMSVAARKALGRVLMALGDVAGADAQLRRTLMQATSDNAVNLRNRIEVAAKMGRGTEARQLFDSLVKAVPDNPGLLAFRGSIDAMFGRFRRADLAMSAVLAPMGPQAVAYYKLLPRIAVGVFPATLNETELAWAKVARDSACDFNCYTTRLGATLAFALRAPRTAWPAGIDSTVDDGRLELAASIARRDTTALRRWTVKIDADARRNIAIGTSEFGWSIIATDGYLALGDTTAALRMIRWHVDSAMGVIPITTGFVMMGRGQFGSAGLWPRAMLMRADLAAATGSNAEAKLWYDRVLSLWAEADAEMQPVIARIRAARARLGP